MNILKLSKKGSLANMQCDICNKETKKLTKTDFGFMCENCLDEADYRALMMLEQDNDQREELDRNGYLSLN